MVLVHVYSVALCQLGSHDSVLLTIRAETNKHSIRLIVPEFHGYLENQTSSSRVHLRVATQNQQDPPGL